MNIRLCRINILITLLLFSAGFVFAEISVISASKILDINQFSKLPGNIANAVNPAKSQAVAATVPVSGAEIEFWLGQTNNHTTAVWTVDESNSTRLQHAIVNAADYSQLVIAAESKYPSDSEKKSISAMDSNACLVESSIAPAGSGSGPPKGQPAPSIVYTLIAGLLTVAGVGWRNIFQTS
jgi:hypothetical protein